MAAAILIAGFFLTRVAFGHNAIGHFLYAWVQAVKQGAADHVTSPLQYRSLRE